MSVRIETVPAKCAVVHRVDRGVELVEGYDDTEVTEEVALALSYDEVVSIEGTEERVNLVAARMLHLVPGGTYVPVRQDTLRTLGHLAEELVATVPSLGDTRELADAIRATLATLTNTR